MADPFSLNAAGPTVCSFGIGFQLAETQLHAPHDTFKCPKDSVSIIFHFELATYLHNLHIFIGALYLMTILRFQS